MAKRLSPQEARVLKLTAEGKSPQEIADVLGISRGAVNRYRQHAEIKTGKRGDALAAHKIAVERGEL